MDGRWLSLPPRTLSLRYGRVPAGSGGTLGFEPIPGGTPNSLAGPGPAAGARRRPSGTAPSPFAPVSPKQLRATSAPEAPADPGGGFGLDPARSQPAKPACSASISDSQAPTADSSFFSHSSPYWATNQSFMPAVASWNCFFSSGVGT